MCLSAPTDLVKAYPRTTPASTCMFSGKYPGLQHSENGVGVRCDLDKQGCHSSSPCCPFDELSSHCHQGSAAGDGDKGGRNGGQEPDWEPHCICKSSAEEALGES